MKLTVSQNHLIYRKFYNALKCRLYSNLSCAYLKVFSALKTRESDLLICHATAQGDSAIRNPVAGSQFIREFCKHLERENELFQVE